MISSVTPSPTLVDGLAALVQVGVTSARSERAERAGPVERAVGRPEDRVEISREADAASRAPGDGKAAGREPTEGDREKVDELQQRDREVRQHEQAHKAAGGDLTGAISYSYTRGPDGRRYVTGGHVPIDASAVDSDPEATISKMQRVRRAALAPAEPSAADRAVASKAQQAEREARAELRETPHETEDKTGHEPGAASEDAPGVSAPADRPPERARIDLVA